MGYRQRITVFTPSYNRAHTLPRTYESLKKQNNKNFIWLIIDDGSTDNTKELVNQWIYDNNEFEIQYIYKENGGMHTAHNVAYEHIYTELNVCIDSDDCLADGAIEKILNFWDNNVHDNYAGIIGLDSDLNGKIIGKDLGDLHSTTLSGYYEHGGKGDKKLVYRTDIIKKYPEYPVFEGEKYVGLGYKYLLCDQDYSLLVLNEILCNVEYQTDGSSMNMFKQYIQNPKGFAFIRKVDMRLKKGIITQFKTCIHYVSSSLISKNKYFIKESPKPVMTFFAIPFGFLLTVYIKSNYKKLLKIKGGSK